MAAAFLGNVGMIALAHSKIDKADSLMVLHESAIASLEVANRFSSSTSRWVHALARAYMLDARWADATELLERAAAKQPHNVLIQFDLGHVYMELGMREDAISAWQKAGADRPILQLAASLPQGQEVKETLPLYDAAVTANPKSALAWRELGKARYQVNDLSGATVALEHAMALDPNDRWVAQTLGWVYLDQQNYDRALELAVWMGSRFPGQPLSPLLYGDIFRALNRYTDAESAYLEALARSPTDAALCERLADLYDRQGRFEDAVQYWEEAVRLAPYRWVYHSQLAEDYLILGQREAALREFQRALELNPSDRGLIQAIQLLVGK